MLDFSKMKQLGKDIYVYKDFLTQEETEFYYSWALSKKENEWIVPNSNNNWINYTNPIKKLEKVRNRIEQIIQSDNLFLGSSTSYIRMKKGCKWGAHSDDHDFLEIIKLSQSYVEGQPYELKESALWGIVVYFNSFVGGQLYYPEQNIEYQPEAGDLVIHSAKNHCRHEVKELLSDIRISYSNHIYELIKVPKNES